MSLRLIATGGTFDKVYDPIAGLLAFDHTTLQQIVVRARLAGPVVVEEAMQIDSLDMNDGHRQQILQLCRAAAEDQLVIVHGTDTMVLTAEVLGRAALGKTIVLTGAMIPYRVDQSDALFNLGYAVACARHAGPGVFVAMNGRTYRWDQVRKNRELGVFETTTAKT